MQNVTITTEEVEQADKHYRRLTIQDGNDRAIITFPSNAAPDSVIYDAIAQYFSRKANHEHRTTNLDG